MLPETCWKCGARDWERRQEVSPPESLDRCVWHRRTWCKFCDAAQEELRSPGLIALTSRDQPIDWTGKNPFLSPDPE